MNNNNYFEIRPAIINGDVAWDLYEWLCKDFCSGSNRVKPSRILKVMERVSLRHKHYEKQTGIVRKKDFSLNVY